MAQGRVGADWSGGGAPVVPLWSTFNQIAIFGQFRDFWCENVFTAHLWAKPCDFCPLNMSYIHISEVPMRWFTVLRWGGVERHFYAPRLVWLDGDRGAARPRSPLITSDFHG